MDDMIQFFKKPKKNILTNSPRIPSSVSEDQLSSQSFFSSPTNQTNSSPKIENLLILNHLQHPPKSNVISLKKKSAREYTLKVPASQITMDSLFENYLKIQKESIRLNFGISLNTQIQLSEAHHFNKTT
jgi:hypothetical protein